ncbi:MAG TPA: VWA domain-containing protein [Pyrinomonadaceae bacterium]|jgi:VWFA-related protein
MRPNRFPPACLVLLVGLFVCALPAAGQTRARRVSENQPAASSTPLREEVDAGELVRVETTLVTVPVSVMDRGGRYVPDLRVEDFELYEDGVPQKIAYFAAVERPFTVVLMLDTSSSVWRKLGRIKDAAEAFVAQLRPEDQVMVVTFAHGLTVKCEPTTDRERIRKAIRGTGRGLSTHLYDALEKVMTKHLKPLSGRKAVVLFTDGVDAQSSHATYDDTLALAEELDALVYPIRYDTYDAAAAITSGGSTSGPRLPGILGRIPLPIPVIGGGPTTTSGGGASRADYARGERYLHELAELTGGRYYEASRDLRDLDRAFSQIADELRRQYSLGYYPAQKGRPGERRRLRVRVRQPDLAVRARDGYIYQPAAPDAATQDQKQTPKPAPVLKKPLVADAGH